MHFLPKANPLYEHISTSKINIPEVLEKLGAGSFTGYLSHTAPGFESFCIFAKGKLICAISTEGERDKAGFEAISLLFDRIASSGGEINVYRMTADLAMCAHALVLGEKLLKGEEVRHVDVKSMLSRMKAQSLNGVVHFYTQSRYAMMFYKNGQPIGFYHDNSRAIEMSPDETRKVAALPGARINVCSTKSIEELMHFDLLQMVNLGKLWIAASTRQASVPVRESAPPKPDPDGKLDARLDELVEDLQDVALAYLSKEGRSLIQRLLKDAGGASSLFDSVKTERLLKQLEDEARIIDSHARIEEMIDLMRSEITGRLAV